MNSSKETVESNPTLRAESVKKWRNWLEMNCEKEKIIWLIVFNKSSKVPSVHWHEAIENALCYGWVDSKAKKRERKVVI